MSCKCIIFHIFSFLCIFCIFYHFLHEVHIFKVFSRYDTFSLKQNIIFRPLTKKQNRLELLNIHEDERLQFLMGSDGFDLQIIQKERNLSSHCPSFFLKPSRQNFASIKGEMLSAFDTVKIRNFDIFFFTTMPTEKGK